MAGESSARDDWRINSDVKTELVKRWVDTGKLKISTTRGTVFIKGKLEFMGKKKEDYELEAAVISFLKQLDVIIKSLPNVKTVQWDLEGWDRAGIRWKKNETKKVS